MERMCRASCLVLLAMLSFFISADKKNGIILMHASFNVYSQQWKGVGEQTVIEIQQAMSEATEDFYNAKTFIWYIHIDNYIIV